MRLLKQSTTCFGRPSIPFLQTAHSRLRRLVCNDILNHAIRLREADEFERRLSALEAALAQMNKEGVK